MKKVLLLLLCSCGLFAGTLKLFNDSSFNLRAVIRGADDSFLGEIVLVPEHFDTWSDDYGSFGGTQYSGTKAPYTVHWYCADGTEFGVSKDVPSGETVNAQSSDGPRTCNPALSQPAVPYGPQANEEELEEQDDQSGED